MRYKAINKRSFPVRVNKDGKKVDVFPGKSIVLDYIPPSDHFDCETVKEKEEKHRTAKSRKGKKKSENKED